MKSKIEDTTYLMDNFFTNIYKIKKFNECKKLLRKNINLLKQNYKNESNNGIF